MRFFPCSSFFLNPFYNVFCGGKPTEVDSAAVFPTQNKNQDPMFDRPHFSAE
ncbi:MAG: hypothetical protein SPI97_08940 [Oscillospiraceae bacterium]|nr:hypothetical protein [Oscillospiraceae bacterium]